MGLARGAYCVAAWFGLVAGLLEVLTKVSCTAIGRSGQLYQMSRHFFWLIPVTNLLVFLGLGLFLALLVWVMPRFGRWLSVRGLGALMLLPSVLVAVPEVYLAAWLVLAWGVAVRFTPLLESHSRGFRRFVMISYPFLVGAVVGLGGWVLGGDWIKQARESTRPLPSPGSPNVLLVVLDTVRADRLSVYGYERKTTPTLERLAAGGVRFDAARFDFALESAVAWEHIHRPPAARAEGQMGRSAGHEVPHSCWLSWIPRLRDGRVRRKHALLWLRHGPGRRLHALRGLQPAADGCLSHGAAHGVRSAGILPAFRLGSDPLPVERSGSSRLICK